MSLKDQVGEVFLRLFEAFDPGISFDNVIALLAKGAANKSRRSSSSSPSNIVFIPKGFGLPLTTLLVDGKERPSSQHCWIWTRNPTACRPLSLMQKNI
jgi:hypothetical protein